MKDANEPPDNGRAPDCSVIGAKKRSAVPFELFEIINWIA